MPKTVLIVDDETDSVEITSLSLRLSGDWNIVKAFNGQDALESIRREPPDVILLDYYLGDSTGAKILEVLQGEQATSKIPVIIYTASPQRVKREPQHDGSTRILTKPVNPSQLSQILEDLIPEEKAE